MANLFITEHDQTGTQGAGQSVSIPYFPPLAQQTVAIGAASVQSAAFNASTRFVGLLAKADCHISVGSSPTATTSLQPLMSGVGVYIGVKPGDKIAVIAA